MAIVVGLAVGLLVGGLVIAWLSGTVKHQPLASIVYYVGIGLVIVGLVLLLTPVMVWVEAQLRSMLRT